MADVLVELGAATRRFYSTMGQAVSPVSVADFFDLVNAVENPIVGVYGADEPIDPKAQVVASRLRAISLRNRERLAREAQATLQGATGELRLSDARGAIRWLNGIVLDSYGLGKKKKKKGGFIKKIGKVVKSPAFLAVAAVAASFIPGVGVVAGAAVASAAAMQAKRLAAKKEEAAIKKRQAAALAAQGGDPEGAARLLAEAEKAEREAEKAQRQIALVEGAGALGVAAGQLIPGAQQRSQEFLKGLPEPLQKIALKLAPGLAADAKSAPGGLEGFIGAALKALGQFSAIDKLARGSGVEGGIDKLSGIDKLGDIASMIGLSDNPLIKKANDAGEQDLEASAAADGEGELVSTAIKRGQPGEFPIVPVVVAGGVTAIGVALILALAA